MTKKIGKSSADYQLFLSLFFLLTLAAFNNPLVGLGAQGDLTPPDGTVTGIVINGGLEYIRMLSDLTD